MTGTTVRSFLLLLFSSIAFASAATAQNTQAPADHTAAETSEAATIVVTGTRRTDRTVADSAVPVDVISAESLANTGHTEVNRALTQEVPSFNFPQPSITDGTYVIRPATRPAGRKRRVLPA